MSLTTAYWRPQERHEGTRSWPSCGSTPSSSLQRRPSCAVETSTTAPDWFAIAVAKARTGEAAGKGAAIARQAFGAMGFTREHPLHYAIRRLWSWRDEFGSGAYWQTEIGRTIARQGADRLWATLTELA